MIPAILTGGDSSSSVFTSQWLMLRPLPVGALALVLLWATLRTSVPWSSEEYRLSTLTSPKVDISPQHSSLHDSGSGVLPISRAGDSSHGNVAFQATFFPTTSLYDAQDVLRVSSNPIGWLIHALRRLETAPILSHEDSHAKNNATCASKERQSNPDQIKGDAEFWANMNETTILVKRQALVDRIRLAYGPLADTGKPTLLPETAKTGGYGKGRGIVFTGGNSVGPCVMMRSMQLINIRRTRYRDCSCP